MPSRIIGPLARRLLKTASGNQAKSSRPNGPIIRLSTTDARQRSAAGRPTRHAASERDFERRRAERPAQGGQSVQFTGQRVTPNDDGQSAHSKSGRAPNPQVVGRRVTPNDYGQSAHSKAAERQAHRSWVGK